MFPFTYIHYSRDFVTFRGLLDDIGLFVTRRSFLMHTKSFNFIKKNYRHFIPHRRFVGIPFYTEEFERFHSKEGVQRFQIINKAIRTSILNNHSLQKTFSVPILLGSPLFHMAISTYSAPFRIPLDSSHKTAFIFMQKLHLTSIDELQRFCAISRCLRSFRFLFCVKNFFDPFNL